MRLPRSNRTEKIEGLIGFFNLTDWWLATFSKEERDHIEAAFKPLGVSFGDSGQNRPLTMGVISSTSETAAGLLSGLATWFTKEEDREIVRRILAKAAGLASAQLREPDIDLRHRRNRQKIFDLHFSYQAMIEDAYRRRQQNPEVLESTVAACQKQIELAPLAARAFRREYPGEPLPGHVGFQELVDIHERQGNYAEAVRVAKDALGQGWAGGWESRILELQVGELWTRAESMLQKEEWDAAKSLVDSVIQIDAFMAARVFKRLGDYFLNHGRNEEAFEYLNRAVATDPLIRGVEKKLKKLSKSLGRKPALDTEAKLRILAEKQREAKEWWAKRDLANEYAKIGFRDEAWALFNEAIILRAQSGGPGDTIYPRMARMLEKEGKYRNALFHYVLGSNELRRFGTGEVPKYVAEGISRCLRKLGLAAIGHERLLELTRDKSNPEDLSNLIDSIIQGRT